MTCAAISLLEAPLPVTSPLPAAAQTLLLKLFDAASSKLDADLLYKVHRLLNGGCEPILSIISTNALEVFEREVFGILRDASSNEQQSLGIHCLAIMKSLLGNSRSPNRNRKHSSSAIASFFSGNRALKTVQLLVLEVIRSCGNDQTQTFKTTSQNVEMAVVVLSAVDRQSRDDWCAQNPRVVQKLLSKSLGSGLKPTIRAQVSAGIQERHYLPRSLTVLVRSSHSFVFFSPTSATMSRYVRRLKPCFWVV